MLHNFFKQSLNTLKNNRRHLENTAYACGALASAYYYPELSRRSAQSYMTFFYSCLSKEEKLVIETDPQRKQEFIEECKTNLKFMIGPPD